MIICINACSKDESINITKKSELANKSDNLLTQVAIVNSIIDPITIEVLQGNKQMTVKLIGLAVPDNKETSQIYESALNFTEFHLHKGKEVRLQKDIYDNSSEFQLRYLFIDGEMYNKLMLTNGYAVLWSINEKFEFKQEFQSIEQKAQDSYLGHWSYQNKILNTPNKTIESPSKNEPAGTLPKINLPKSVNNKCDYTNNNVPVIKGNNDLNTGIKTYYLPDSIFYKTIDINKDDGDKLLCTVSEAEINGWTKSKH